MNIIANIVSKIKNRKLRKLLRNPKQYFLDADDLQPIFRFLGIQRDFRYGRKNGGAHVSDSFGHDISGLELFDLIGDNWLDESSPKPLAILFGFHPWKRDFVSRYLPEYRTAFSRGMTPWGNVRPVLDSLDDVHFIFWGYTEREELAYYAHRRGIPVFRMEDGFVRSADLGSEHSTPLSLVLDKIGLYYDGTRPSDLEKLLQEHDFAVDAKMMAAADTLMMLYRELRVSKYNLGSFRSVVGVLGQKLKRRVLVLGQVEDDSSIAYGLAQGWTCQQLIELAKAENPDSEIIYKPHPDVVQGFRTNSVALKDLQETCRLVLSPVVLADLFGEVDHVYTITSLAGMEALLHGLPVTVVGAPFYAGWGLTDDRQMIPRRTRRLSLAELFCGTYLLYPRYLADLENPVIGCLATIIGVIAQRRNKLNNEVSIDKETSIKVVESNAAWLAASAYWPVLLAPKFFSLVEKKYGNKLLRTLSVRRIFAACQGDYYQRSVAYLLAGKLRETAVFGTLLFELRTTIRPPHFGALLTDLWQILPSRALMEQWAWHCERLGSISDAREAFNHTSFTDEFPNGGQKQLPIPASKFGFVLKHAQFELRQRNLEEASHLFNRLLLSGYLEGGVVDGLAEIARLRFDFSSSAALLKLYNHLAPAWQAGVGHLRQAQAAALGRNIPDAVDSMALASFINPRLLGSMAEDTVVDLSSALGDLPYAEAMLAAVDVVSDSGAINRAKGLIAHERPVDAERLLLKHTPTMAEIEHYSLTLSQAYSFQGKIKEASQLITYRLKHTPTLLMYREGLRLAVLANNRVWTEQLIAEVEARGIEVGEIYLRKAAALLRDIRSIHLNFRKMTSSKMFKAYLGDRYVQSLVDMPRTAGARGVVVAYFGPGDEIRWASLYPRMREWCGEALVSFTCDPRLHMLLERSYKNLNFVPVRRVRNLNWAENYRDYTQLPGSDLCRHFDNTGWNLVAAADKVILQLDALGDLIEDYDSLDGLAYLMADPDKVAEWRRRLLDLTDKPVVGLSWRSSLMTYSRNGHYLSVEELAPLFEHLPSVQFVNLQYDECTDELTYLEQRFPGRIIHFDDLDQYNDLDNVAALMSCLDLVIAPAITVVEMAGALGVETLFLANSVEDHWRQRPGSKVDVWHSSITHVEGEILGDKSSLILALLKKLRERFPAQEGVVATDAASALHDTVEVVHTSVASHLECME